MIPNSVRMSVPARTTDPRALYILSVVDRIGDIRDPESLAKLLEVHVMHWPIAAVRSVVEQILAVMPERDLDEYVATAAAAMVDTKHHEHEGALDVIRESFERWRREGNAGRIKRALEPLGWRDNLTTRSIDELARLAMVLVEHETPERISMCADEVEVIVAQEREAATHGGAA